MVRVQGSSFSRRSLLVGEAQVAGCFKVKAYAQYSGVEYTRNRAAVRGVLAPALHPQPATCLSNVTRENIFLRKATR